MERIVGQMVLDTRDVMARIEYLEMYLDEMGYPYLPDRCAPVGYEENPDVFDKWIELADLIDFEAQLRPYGDYETGEVLIYDGYFEEYARDLAYDIHGASLEIQVWPLDCIDWAQAARELQSEYTSAEINGYTYWMRM